MPSCSTGKVGTRATSAQIANPNAGAGFRARASSSTPSHVLLLLHALSHAAAQAAEAQAEELGEAALAPLEVACAPRRAKASKAKRARHADSSPMAASGGAIADAGGAEGGVPGEASREGLGKASATATWQLCCVLCCVLDAVPVGQHNAAALRALAQRAAVAACALAETDAASTASEGSQLRLAGSVMLWRCADSLERATGAELQPGWPERLPNKLPRPLQTAHDALAAEKEDREAAAAATNAAVTAARPAAMTDAAAILRHVSQHSLLAEGMLLHQVGVM